jgi:hypothetical protein
VHEGLILSDKDSRYSRYHTLRHHTFKQLPVAKRHFLLTCKSPSAFDEELDRLLHGPKQTQLSLFESKKLHKEAFNLLKKRRNLVLKDQVTDFKA